MPEENVNQAEGDVDRIVRQRFFPAQESGVFVEVGAAKPNYISMSALYRALGWQVIAIEPNPVFCDLHRSAGYPVLQYACGDHDEDDVDFCVVNSKGARYKNGEVSFESFSSLAIKDSFASLNPEMDITKIKVKLRRLDTILAAHAPEVGEIDFLCIDVEGWELEVLDGLDLERYRPRVMVIENYFRDRKYRKYMRARGYRLWKCIRPNDIYTREPVSVMERVAGFFGR
jgi:FkbM family methyltransferase